MLLDWEGLNTEIKRGRGKGRVIVTRRFIEKHRGRNGQFFSLHFKKVPFKTFSLEPSIPLLQDAGMEF